MSGKDWNASGVECLEMALPGDRIAEIGERSERIAGDSVVLLFNAHHEPVPFRLRTRGRDVRWTCINDSAAPAATERAFEHLSEFSLQARSVAVLRGDSAKHQNHI